MWIEYKFLEKLKLRLFPIHQVAVDTVDNACVDIAKIISFGEGLETSFSTRWRYARHCVASKPCAVASTR